MLSVSTRYNLAKLVDQWRREKGFADCPASTIRFLMMNGLLDEDRVRAFESKQAFLNKLEVK